MIAWTENVHFCHHMKLIFVMRCPVLLVWLFFFPPLLFHIFRLTNPSITPSRLNKLSLINSDYCFFINHRMMTASCLTGSQAYVYEPSPPTSVETPS